MINAEQVAVTDARNLYHLGYERGKQVSYDVALDGGPVRADAFRRSCYEAERMARRVPVHKPWVRAINRRDDYHHAWQEYVRGVYDAVDKVAAKFYPEKEVLDKTAGRRTDVVPLNGRFTYDGGLPSSMAAPVTPPLMGGSGEAEEPKGWHR